MLRPSAADNTTPEPLSVAVTPVEADCALIAATVLARLPGSAAAVVPVLATVMVRPFSVNVDEPTAVAVTADVPAAAVLTAALAVKPLMPEALIALAIALASVATLPRLYTVPGPVSVIERLVAAPLVIAPRAELLKPLNWPSTLALALTSDATLIWSLLVLLAPTWNVWVVNVPSRSFTPLNDDAFATRSISC